MALRQILPPFIFLVGLFSAAPAFAANGFTTANVNMRTGPGVRYARIAVIPAGARVIIRQCLQGRSWCSVRWRSRTGWVSRRYLRFVGYRPRVYSQPPVIYFDFYDRRWRDDHDRWHRSRSYSRRKIDRRRWNRDHDRLHRKFTKKKKRVVKQRKKRLSR